MPSVYLSRENGKIGGLSGETGKDSGISGKDHGHMMSFSTILGFGYRFSLKKIQNFRPQISGNFPEIVKFEGDLRKLSPSRHEN